MKIKPCEETNKAILYWYEECNHSLRGVYKQLYEPLCKYGTFTKYIRKYLSHIVITREYKKRVVHNPLESRVSIPGIHKLIANEKTNKEIIRRYDKYNGDLSMVYSRAYRKICTRVRFFAYIEKHLPALQYPLIPISKITKR